MFSSTLSHAMSSACLFYFRSNMVLSSGKQVDRRIVIYPADKQSKLGLYYVAVVNNSDTTEYSLCAIASGQSTEQSDSMQHIDSLISNFHTLANLVNHDLEKQLSNPESTKMSEFLIPDTNYSGIHDHYLKAFKSNTNIDGISLAGLASVMESTSGEKMLEGKENHELNNSADTAESKGSTFLKLFERLIDHNEPELERANKSASKSMQDIDKFSTMNDDKEDQSLLNSDEDGSLKNAIQELVATRLSTLIQMKSDSSVRVRKVKRPARTPNVIAYSYSDSSPEL